MLYMKEKQGRGTVLGRRVREDSLDVKYKQVPEGSGGGSWPCCCLAGVSLRQREE